MSRADVHNMRLNERRLLSVQECEGLSGISVWTWRRWAYAGKIASVKMGTRLMVEMAEFDRAIAENRRPRTPEVVVAA